MERCFAYADAGRYRLPLDIRTENEKCVTCADRFLECRRDPLIDYIDNNLGTHHLFSSPTLLSVFRITGERNDIPA